MVFIYPDKGKRGQGARDSSEFGEGREVAGDPCLLGQSLLPACLQVAGVYIKHRYKSMDFSAFS